MKQYEIARSSYRCNDCQRELAVQEEFVAAVQQDEQEEDLLRQDYCLDCWGRRTEQGREVLGFWRTRVPAPQAKKKLLVDDELLIGFFQRLQDTDSESMLQFRFVLALILMRKRLLIYDGMEKDGASEFWLMHLRGSTDRTRVLDPHLDQDKIAQVSQHLGQILEAEL